MIKLIDLNYYAHSNVSNPEEVLELQKASIGFVDFIKEKVAIQLIKHCNYEGKKKVNDVEYIFFKNKNKFLHIPFKTHRYIQKRKPDIVLIQGFIFPLQLIALKCKLSKKTKIMVQHHGEKPYSGIKKVFQKIADHFIDVYFFTSIENANEWIDKKIIRNKEKCCELLEASTSFSLNNQLQSNWNNDFNGNQSFLWVGRLNKGKDPMTVIYAFEKYTMVCAEARLFMIFQTEELLPVINGKLKENELLKKAVILKGKVHHCELQAWYNAADFFISGSHKEGSGYALIEAMSCGCIPIVTNIPSFKKITCEGSYGFLFEPGKAESLLNILLNLKNIEREKLSQSVINHFNNSLSFRSIAEELFAACERLMEK